MGTASANLLARAGVGFLRLVDRDRVELSNLPRQILYTEKDAADAVPKAAAAAAHLREVNSDIRIEAVVNEFNSSTADGLISDADLVIDASDNLKTRYLLNEACHHLKKNWIYGGAVGATGMTCNFLFGDGAPCMRCVTGSSDASEYSPNCVNAGVLNMVTSIVASIQCAEAVKILTGSGEIRKTMVYFDLWKNKFEELPVEKDPDCPVCVKENYVHYGKR